MDGRTTVAVESNTEDVAETAVWEESTAVSVSFLLGSILCGRKVIMDEQRQEAYISLINQLLTCPSGQELAVLNANPTLVDAGLVETLEKVSNLLQQQGRKDAADFLMQIAEQLGRAIEQPASTPNASTSSTQDSQYVFFQKLILTAWNNPSSQVVYPLLAANLDKLNDDFIVLLQKWSNVNISR